MQRCFSPIATINTATLSSGRHAQGKDKPTWRPHLDCGDVVVVINSKDVVFTRNKWERKTYKWHTGCGLSASASIVLGFAAQLRLSSRYLRDPVSTVLRYMGGLQERTAEDEHKRDPTSVLRKAVERMLPKTNLQKVRVLVFIFVLML